MGSEFDEAISHWSSRVFISNYLHIDDGADLAKEVHDVVLVHPGLDIANPESFGVLVISLSSHQLY